MWTDADRSGALAWLLRESRRCKRCGTFPDEWVHPPGTFDENGNDLSGRWVDPPPYQPTPHPCGGCRASGRLRKAWEKQKAPTDHLTVRMVDFAKWQAEQDQLEDDARLPEF
jgi:hypothetical protein